MTVSTQTAGLAREVLYAPAPQAYVAGLVREVLFATKPVTRVTSFAREVLLAKGVPVYCSSFVREVLFTSKAVRVAGFVREVLFQPAPTGQVGLFQSDVIPSSTDTYTEFGSVLNVAYNTALLPDNQEQRNNAMQITTAEIGFIGNTPQVSATFTDSSGNVLQTAVISPSNNVYYWDGCNWDAAYWDGAPSPASPWIVPWPGPVVFKQGFMNISAKAAVGFRLGIVYYQYQELGYVQQYLSGSS